MRMARLAAVAAVGLAAGTSVSGCGDDDDGTGEGGADAGPGKIEVTEDSPIEAQLVSIDENSPVVERLKVCRYSRALDRLEERCKNPRERIADFATRGKELLAKDGIEFSTFQMLRTADGSIPAAAGRTDCTDIFAAVVTVTRQEQEP